jgi:hypothetical protein
MNFIIKPVAPKPLASGYSVRLFAMFAGIGSLQYREQGKVRFT